MLLSNICILQAFPDKDSSPAFLFQYQFFKKSEWFPNPLEMELWACLLQPVWAHGPGCGSTGMEAWKAVLFSPLLPMRTDPASPCTPILAGIGMKGAQTEQGCFASVCGVGVVVGQGEQEAPRLVSLEVTVKRPTSALVTRISSHLPELRNVRINPVGCLWAPAKIQ